MSGARRGRGPSFFPTIDRSGENAGRRESSRRNPALPTNVPAPEFLRVIADRPFSMQPRQKQKRAAGWSGALPVAFSRFAHAVSFAVGRPMAFAIACLIVLFWLISGPFFGYSDTWQLLINTGTTIVTFLMVFLIQNSQIRDSAAIQVKLDELIRTSTAAQNFYVGIEHLTHEELEDIRNKCEARARAAAEAEAVQLDASTD